MGEWGSREPNHSTYAFDLQNSLCNHVPDVRLVILLALLGLPAKSWETC